MIRYGFKRFNVLFQCYYDVSMVATGFLKRTELSSRRVSTKTGETWFALVKCDLSPTAEVGRELYILHGMSSVLLTSKRSG